MDYELWAIDAGAGEAILRQGEQWWILSIDHNWEILPIKRDNAYRWALSGSGIAVGERFSDLSGIIDKVRFVCLAALRERVPLSSDYIISIMSEGGVSTPGQKQMFQLIRLREVIRMYARRLDIYFESLGMSGEESQRLRCETFRRVKESAVLMGQEENLGYKIFALARQVFSDDNSAIQSPNRESEQGIRRLQWAQDVPLPSGWNEVLSGLSKKELICISLWAEAGAKYTHEDVATIMQIAPRNVREWLERIAIMLGQRPIQLRNEGIRRASLDLLALRSDQAEGY